MSRFYYPIFCPDTRCDGEKQSNLQNRFSIYEESTDLLIKLDRLLGSHSNHKLENWVELARKFGDSNEENFYYESNAKRLNTAWACDISEYAARTWNGLVGSYYAQRWQLWLDVKKIKSRV